MIYLLTLSKSHHLFGSAGQSWKKLNTKKIIDLLDSNVQMITFEDLENIKFKKEDVLIYTSSENPIVRQYIKNNLYFIKDECQLVPSYDLLMSHEDKGFQEIVKKRKHIGNLEGNYIFDLEDAKLDLPKVLKTSEGAGSSGVFLIKEKKDVIKIKKDFFSEDLKRKLVKVQRKLKLNKSQYSIYNYKYKKFNLFVEQEFVADLQHDFKVLIFGDRYFVLQRSVRKNDFRASGSGNFKFIDPPKEVLDYAKEINSALASPYLSLDIAQSEKGCHLIEFQATNFGPYTLLNAPNYYVFYSGKWDQEKNCKDLESNYAYALNYYLKNKLHVSS